MKINVDLMNALQEAEELKIKKTVLMEGTNVEIIEEAAEEPVKEDQIEDAREESREKGLCEEPAEDATPAEALQKSELTEDADSDILNKLFNGETVYFREESGDPVAITLTKDFEAPEEYDQGLQGEELEKAQQAAVNGEVWKAEHIEENDIEMPIDVAAIIYGEDELKTYLSTLRHVNVISTLEEKAAEEPVKEAAPIDNTIIDNGSTDEDRLASLKAQLEQNGDQLADDEKEAIEKEIADLEAKIYPVEEACSDKKETVKEDADNKICEAETKGLKISQNQGNIFMLEDENKKIYVGENYNEAEKILENAEIYESLEEAEKDYLSRCGLNIED